MIKEEIRFIGDCRVAFSSWYKEFFALENDIWIDDFDKLPFCMKFAVIESFFQSRGVRIVINQLNETVIYRETKHGLREYHAEDGETLDKAKENAVITLNELFNREKWH